MRRAVGLLAAVLLAACGPAGAPGAAPASPTATASAVASVAPTQEAGPERHCETTKPNPGSRRNRGITATLCVDDRTPQVGQRVTFSVEARDPDARLFGLSNCEPDVLTFGDETEFCAGGPACAPDQPGDTYPKREGRLKQRRRHVYAAPGDYTAHLQLQSGSQCPHPYASRLSLKLDLTVQ